MRLRFQFLLGLALCAFSLSTAWAGDKEAVAPSWDREELSSLFARIQSAARAASVSAKDRALAIVAGTAYRVRIKSGDSTESYSKRILRKRKPEHPAVKKGQWLTALTHQFYRDLSGRCRLISRFERDRGRRRYFEDMAKQTAAVAKQLKGQLVFVVNGLDDSSEPLPAIGGVEPSELGVKAQVHGGGKVTVQRLDRITFENHQAPDGHPRTASGALRELYSSQKQYNTFAKTIGKYDRKQLENFGHMQLQLPVAYPAIYLNELTRAALEAGMHTIHLMTVTPRGELREVPLAIKTPKKKRRRRRRKKKSKKLVTVRCADDLSMTMCAKKIKQAASEGRIFYKL